VEEEPTSSWGSKGLSKALVGGGTGTPGGLSNVGGRLEK